MLDDRECDFVDNLYPLRRAPRLRRIPGLNLVKFWTRFEKARRYRGLRKAYQRIAGCDIRDREWGIDRHAFAAHRISIYGPPCTYCGKPLRTPRAKLCAACGKDRLDRELPARDDRRRSP